jgi:carboxyl-terminal processing protease
MNIIRAITRKERLVWIVLTAALAGFVLIIALAPNLVAQAKGSGDDQQALQKFNQIFYYVKDNYVDLDKTESKRLIDGALDGMLKSLGDPYSTYITGDAVREFNESSTGTFGGLGMTVSKQRLFDKNNKAVENTPVEVIAPIEGTPAFRAGIVAGDLIMKVNGESTINLDLDEVVLKMRGTPGTPVTLTIRRNNAIDFDLPIVRGVIEIPSVKSALINGKIGYVRILEFDEQSPARTKAALTDLLAKGATSLVIDLRYNPGGLLESVVAIVDYFLSDGTIVSILGRAPAQNIVYFAKKFNDIVPPKMPVAVLIDHGSASASEIFAGAMKDTGRAVIIGQKSYGKGSVQVAAPLEGAYVKMTVARYFMPSGVTPDKVGILPDIEVKNPEYTELELASYSRIVKENLIFNFVAKNPKPSEKQIFDFIVSLQKQGIDLRESALRVLVLAEVYRKTAEPPIYDLVGDAALQKAVDTVTAKTK